MDINHQIQDVLKAYPTLDFDQTRNMFVGELFISKYDYYDLEIDISPFPRFFPDVYEVGERIPKKADRHIYVNSETCCLSTSAKAQILLKTKIGNLRLFIKDILIPYLQNNSYFEINKRYRTDEYAHGGIGIIQGYMDILKMDINQIDDVLKCALLMDESINGKKLNVHDQCYCRSGMKLKNCKNGSHYSAYRDFRNIEVGLLNSDLRTYFEPILEMIIRK
jgi:hypothetical protein